MLTPPFWTINLFANLYIYIAITWRSVESDIAMINQNFTGDYFYNNNKKLFFV